MFRIGMTCFVLSWLAGCAAQVSLKDDTPVTTTPRPVAPTVREEPDLGRVQVLPIDQVAPVSPTREFPVTQDLPNQEERTEAPSYERLRGVFSEQGWQLCGQRQAKALRASTALRDALESFLAQRPVFFLDAWGRADGNDIELASIERMVVDGSGCREPLAHFVWIARGQEPAWAFAITQAGMQWRRPGESPRTYAYTTAQLGNDSVRYVGADYRLTLHRKTCTQAGQTDAHYAWIAELDIDGQQWRGCAWRGMQSGIE